MLPAGALHWQRPQLLLSHVRAPSEARKLAWKTACASAGISLKTTHRFGAHLRNHARTSAPSEEDALHESDTCFFSPALRRTLCYLGFRGASRRRNCRCPERKSCPDLQSRACSKQSCSRHRAHAAALVFQKPAFQQPVFQRPDDRTICSRHGSDEEPHHRRRARTRPGPQL